MGILTWTPCDGNMMTIRWWKGHQMEVSIVMGDPQLAGWFMSTLWKLGWWLGVPLWRNGHLRKWGSGCWEIGVSKSWGDGGPRLADGQQGGFPESTVCIVPHEFRSRWRWKVQHEASKCPLGISLLWEMDDSWMTLGIFWDIPNFFQFNSHVEFSHSKNSMLRRLMLQVSKHGNNYGDLCKHGLF